MYKTRVEKYKEYRDSMITEDAIKYEHPGDNTYTKDYKDRNNTTSALPIEQVMDLVGRDQEEAEFIKKMKRKKALVIGLISLVAAVIIAVLVIFGIIVFRG